MRLRYSIRVSQILILATALSGAHNAFGDCEPRDFRSAIPGGYHQGDTGWCFAHSVAACLSQVLGKKVSAGAIAIDAVLTNEEDLDHFKDPASRAYLHAHPEVKRELHQAHGDDRDHYDLKKAFAYKRIGEGDDSSMEHHGIMDLGGSEDFALLIAKEHGICTDDKLPSGNRKYEADLDELTDSLKKNLANPPPGCDSENPLATLANDVGDLVGTASPILRRTLEDWTNQKCGAREPISTPMVPRVVAIKTDLDQYTTKYPVGSVKRARARQKLFAELNANFDRGRISAVDYDYCEHAASHTDSGECAARKDDGSVGEPTEDHSGILTARKKINGVCSYFLQNHDRGCGDYTDQIQKATYTEAGQTRPVCEPDASGIWVTANQFQTIYSVFSIK